MRALRAAERLARDSSQRCRLSQHQCTNAGQNIGHKQTSHVEVFASDQVGEAEPLSLPLFCIVCTHVQDMVCDTSTVYPQLKVCKSVNG